MSIPVHVSAFQAFFFFFCLVSAFLQLRALQTICVLFLLVTLLQIRGGLCFMAYFHVHNLCHHQNTQTASVPLISVLTNSALGALLCVITSGFSFVVPPGTRCLSSLFNPVYPVLHLQHHPSYLCNSNTFLSSAILKCLLESLIQSI